jgi:hypothetical protein
MRSRSRGAYVSEFCCWAGGRCEIVLRSPPLAACFCLPSHKKEGKRNADRRVVTSRALRGTARAQRSALVCRRPTAALAAATERHRSTPATRFLRLRRHQVLPASGLVPVQREIARSTGRNAGRAYPPEPPGSGVQIPPAGTAPAPPLGLPPGGVPVRERDICSAIRRTWHVKDDSGQRVVRSA